MTKKSIKQGASRSFEVDITHQISNRHVAQSGDSIGNWHIGQSRSESYRVVARPELSEGPVVLDETGFGEFQKIHAMGVLARLRLHPLAAQLGVNESSLLHTLVSARGLVRHGWCQDCAWCNEDGESNPVLMGVSTRFSLVGALRTAGEGQLVVEYAIRAVRAVLGEYNLNKWNDNPVRTKAQVIALLDGSVEFAGGKPRRKGGRIVSSGPWGTH